MKKIILLFFLIFSTQTFVWADSTFVVNNIEFQGLQRVSKDTIENYLPIKRGQTFHENQSSEVLRALYKTGFFERISLSQQGNTLIIRVVERPTIGQLTITGNSMIPTDKLTTVMKNLDVAEGRIYNPSTLEKIKQSLLNQYYQLGRYNARVDVQTSPMTRNRLLVKVDISEGLVSKIRRITIIGNHAFSDSTLIKEMEIDTPGLLTFYTQKDRYSEEKLEGAMDKLRNFYMDKGYLRFEVKSYQAQVTPDRKSVFITIVVSEGPVYTVKDYGVEGDLIIPREKVLKHIQVKPGETFSREKIITAEKAITAEYGSQGYMFSTVNVRPEISDSDRSVRLLFNVRSGRHAYVRRITFSDNVRTNDVVLRREMVQMEAAPASTRKLEISKQRLSLLPYIKEVEMSINPVPGLDDQVDINYKVKENSSATASVKLGYSQLQGVFVGAGINQQNFMGTGNNLGINLQRSKYEQFYGFEYTNPYYTPEGISRSFNFSISRVDPGVASNVNSGYTASDYRAGVLYGIPVGQETGAFNRVYAGATYQNTLINTSSNPKKVSNQVRTFLNEHGRRFQELDFTLGYTRDSRDRSIFPTRGSLNTFFFDFYAPVAHNSVTFYTANYHGKLYVPLNEKFIFLTKLDLGYGNGWHGVDDYPFFRNYYAGGIDSVRGYAGYTLGPRDSLGKAFGGNMLANGSIALIFPNYITDTLRTSVFFDAGNVYTSLNNRRFGGASTTSGPIRYSAGLEADWLTPFGPIVISVAKPLNRQFGHGNIRGDEQKIFDFALNSNF
jgi:outer membrane protein insertion porin family